jgi:hypothetical protein
MKRAATRVATLSLLLATLHFTALSAHAAEGGYTNYFPGFYGDFGVAVAPDPGPYFMQYLFGYTADGGRTRFVQNGEIRTDVELDLALYAAVGLMVLDKKIAGGRYGFGGWVPVTYQDLSFTLDLGPLSRSVSDDLIGVGDVGFIPAYFWWDLGKKVHIAAFEQITVPTGSYDINQPLNNSLNYWSFDTNFAVTYLNEKKGYEISGNIGYIYNTKNNATDYRTGQELHLDYMFNKYLSAASGIGIQGFFYQQITGDSGSGAVLGPFKGEAAGIGPAVMWSKQYKRKKGLKGLVFTAKWLHEFHAMNRLKGDYLELDLTLEF